MIRLSSRLFLIPVLVGFACSGLAFADEPGTPEIPAAKIIDAIYSCDSGETIKASYDNTDAAAPKARLEYKRRSFDMYSVMSASGARYATEQGLETDKGLEWWTKGNEATLSEMIMDHTAPEPTVIETCRTEPA